MSWPEIILFIIALIIMLVGILGVILPILPGVPMIFVAALAFGALTGFAHTTIWTIIVFAILTALSLVLDWAATAFGVRKMGGSYLGMIGALLGMIAGLFIPGFGIFGFLLGAFAGAFLFEAAAGKDSRAALRAGLGSFVGFLIGGALKFAIAAAMIGIFIWQTLR